MREIIGPVVAALIRAGLQALAGWFVGMGLWEASDARAWVTAATEPVAAGVLLFLVSVSMSIWEKIKARNLAILALRTHPAEDMATVHARQASMSWREILHSILG